MTTFDPACSWLVSRISWMISARSGDSIKNICESTGAKAIVKTTCAVILGGFGMNVP